MADSAHVPIQMPMTRTNIIGPFLPPAFLVGMAAMANDRGVLYNPPVDPLLEIIAFSDRLKEFHDIGTEVLGVSVDSEYSHLAWIQMPRDDGGLGDIAYPLLSDLKKELATNFGVLGPDGAAYRGLFIIDKAGIVQHATINNMAFGRNVDEVLRVLKAIQYTQENPDEVCPAGWQPGEKTMKPTFEGKKEYFSS